MSERKYWFRYASPGEDEPYEEENENEMDPVPEPDSYERRQELMWTVKEYMEKNNLDEEFKEMVMESLNNMESTVSIQ